MNTKNEYHYIYSTATMLCAEAIAECQISGTRHRGPSPSVRSKALDKTKAHDISMVSRVPALSKV